MKKNIQKAIQSVPKLIEKTVKDLKLEEINRENLLQGKDSEGNDMPFYSLSEYGMNKRQRNPRNRGRWDLKDTGQFHQNIFTHKIKSYVTFKNKLRSKKFESIMRKMEVANREPMGIPQKEITRLLEEKRPEIKKKIEDIIAGKNV
ncbi:hypothetical protein [Chryseobacterium sp. Leaf180]|uniref:hypothetical protein n=1 Tax=Chryseobacterium sp. Leaf180 TaxID=1736289 RepID=UPI00161CCEC4|nr:hypothetical protein [Chryseobacterium sp. Leaf180]